jgi:hypothetical protein
MMKSHHSSNLYIDTVEGKVTETNQVRSIDDVKEQAVQVTQAAKSENRVMEEMLNGVLTTRELVRLITNSTKKQAQ